MSKAIFTTKVDPAYDDRPEAHYHFPRIYLRQVEAAARDWIVYYEPRRSDSGPSSRGGRQVYFATARVESIQQHPTLPDHFYAFVSGYLEFSRPVPFREGADFYYESALRKPDGGTSKGAFGRAVRTIPDAEYDRILQAGFVSILGSESTSRPAMAGLAEDQVPFERPIVERVIARPFRDAAFAVAVKSAYEDTCAFTGLKIINGGGRSEVQAAHIHPVAQAGPDTVRNGLALSGTVHWMFDRGLLSMDDDLTILTARDRVPDTIQRLLNPNGKLLTPTRPDSRPNPRFMRFHRETVFKG